MSVEVHRVKAVNPHVFVAEDEYTQAMKVLESYREGDVLINPDYYKSLNDDEVALGLVAPAAERDVPIFTLGPFLLTGSVSLSGVDATLWFSYFFGKTKLVRLVGNLEEGVGAEFRFLGIASGSIKLYLRGFMLAMRLEAQTILGNFNKDIEIIRIK